MYKIFYFISMNRRLSLYKGKLPRRKRRASDDDVYVGGLFDPFLDTTGGGFGFVVCSVLGSAVSFFWGALVVLRCLFFSLGCCGFGRVLGAFIEGQLGFGVELRLLVL